MIKIGLCNVICNDSYSIVECCASISNDSAYQDCEKDLSLVPTHLGVKSVDVLIVQLLSVVFYDDIKWFRTSIWASLSCVILLCCFVLFFNIYHLVFCCTSRTYLRSHITKLNISAV